MLSLGTIKNIMVETPFEGNYVKVVSTGLITNQANGLRANFSQDILLRAANEIISVEEWKIIQHDIND
jgi:hypothetical protein